MHLHTVLHTGKTSLIRQLVGEDFKFEPEKEAEAKLERQRAELNSQWLSKLCKHERLLEQSVETKRLSSLLASQIELQQLLLQQQRNNNQRLMEQQHRLQQGQRPTAATTNQRKSLPGVEGTSGCASKGNSGPASQKKKQPISLAINQSGPNDVPCPHSSATASTSLSPAAAPQLQSGSTQAELETDQHNKASKLTSKNGGKAETENYVTAPSQQQPTILISSISASGSPNETLNGSPGGQSSGCSSPLMQQPLPPTSSTCQTDQVKNGPPVRAADANIATKTSASYSSSTTTKISDHFQAKITCTSAAASTEKGLSPLSISADAADANYNDDDNNNRAKSKHAKEGQEEGGRSSATTNLFGGHSLTNQLEPNKTTTKSTDPIENANHVPSSAGATQPAPVQQHPNSLRSQASGPGSDQVQLLRDQCHQLTSEVALKQSGAFALSQLVGSSTKASSGPFSSALQTGSLKQKSLEIGLLRSGQASKHGAHAQQQPLASQQHRHSYCCQTDQTGASPTAKQQATKPQLDRAQNELSTQAKIINILFTRNTNTESGAKSTTGEPGKPQQQHAQDGENAAKTRPMLMPSLLRQYQRRLSNFHQSTQERGATNSTAKSAASGCNDGERAAANASPSRSTTDTMRALEEQNRRRLAAEASKAAASLATMAASAAQALLVHNRLCGQALIGEATNVDSVPQGAAAAGTSWSPLSNESRNHAKLYALTNEFRKRLALSQATTSGSNEPSTGQTQQQQPPVADPLNENSARLKATQLISTTTMTTFTTSTTTTTVQQEIRYFSANFVNEMNIYEINIVDMPTIEPTNFPTSSLVEWSRFKGRSHLLTADAYLLVFDLTRPATIQYIKMLRDKIFEAREMSQVPVYVIANKADLCPTLQPSLQARQMRNVAVRYRNQTAANQRSDSSGPNQRQAGEPSQGGQQVAGSKQQTGSKLTSSKSFTSGATATAARRTKGLKRGLLATGAELSSGLGVPVAGGACMNRSVPAAAAHQLLAAYKVHRMRLGSRGPIVSLRRWGRLRRLVKTAGADSAGDYTSQAAQWLQFERQRNLHYNLIVGAASGDSLGNKWGSSLSKALARCKSFLVSGIRRIGGDRAATGESALGRMARGKSQQRGLTQRQALLERKRRRRRRQRRRRRRLTGQSTPVAVSQGRRKSLGQLTSAKQAGALKTSGRFNGSLVRWITRSHESESDPGSSSARTKFPSKRAMTEPKQSRTMVGGLVNATLLASGLKRNRTDQGNGTDGSKADPVHRESGVAPVAASTSSSQQPPVMLITGVTGQTKRKQQADSGLVQYSKMLASTAADQHAGAGDPMVGAVSPLAPNIAGAQQQLDSIARLKIEPVCGAMSMPASRQNFYDLFNQLLQTSSTTAAKTQLKLSGLCGSPQDNEATIEKSKDDMSKENATATAKNERQQSGQQSANLLQVEDADGKKAGKRRKSSTGAALWHTLSSITLSARHRDSNASALTRAAKSEVAEQQQLQAERRGTQSALGDGLHLGTDQYLSVDMLRKLSLISANSQTTADQEAGRAGESEGAGKDDEEVSEEQKRALVAAAAAATTTGSQNQRKASKGVLSLLSRRLSGMDANQTEERAENSTEETRPKTCTPGGSRAKRIWYRGMVKRILFHSNKHSLGNIVTAMELQRRADAQWPADSGEAGEPEVAADESAEAHKLDGLNNQRELQAEQESEQKEKPKVELEGQQIASKLTNRRQSLTVSDAHTNAPSIRIITSGSSLSLLSENSGRQEGQKEDEAKREQNNGSGSESVLEPQAGQQRQHQMSPTSGQLGSGVQDNLEPDVHNDLCPQVETGPRQHKSLQSASIMSSCDGSTTGGPEIISTGQLSSAQSLSSLADSVSLSLADTIGPASSGKTVTGGRRAQSAVAARRTPPNDMGEAGPGRNSAVSLRDTDVQDRAQQPLRSLPVAQNEAGSEANGDSDVGDGEEEDEEEEDEEESGPMSALQEPELANCTLRKLSADDCLIINRQRRQSLANAAEISGTGQILLDKEKATSASNKRDESNPGAKAREGKEAAEGETAENPARPPKDPEQMSAEARRQSIKQSIETAIHLLVPRAKGTRSASITLGATDCEQRSRSQLGTTIMGAVSVHKTWRDWRQLLSRKKSTANAGASGGGANERNNKLRHATRALLAGNERKSDLIDEPILPLAGFLGTQLANLKLNSEQQREAAINVDQLMRINQLTLSAANVVMMPTGPQTHATAAQLGDFVFPSIAGSEHRKSRAAGGRGQKRQAASPAGRSTLAADLEVAAAISADDLETFQQHLKADKRKKTKTKRSDKCKKAADSRDSDVAQESRRSQRPLMTRLQSGGNLLLRRTSTRKKERQLLGGQSDTAEATASNGMIMMDHEGAQDAAASDATQMLRAITGGGPEKANGRLLSAAVEGASSSLGGYNGSAITSAAAESPAADRSALGARLRRSTEASHIGDEQAAATGKPSALVSSLPTDANMSAQIAAAAAGALERQKRRGEQLSLILEPRFDKKQPGAQYPLFASHDLNPILKDLAQLVRKHWKCNYIECSAANSWNIKPIISELTRALECNQFQPASSSSGNSGAERRYQLNSVGGSEFDEASDDYYLDDDGEEDFEGDTELDDCDDDDNDFASDDFSSCFDSLGEDEDDDDARDDTDHSQPRQRCRPQRQVSCQSRKQPAGASQGPLSTSSGGDDEIEVPTNTASNTRPSILTKSFPSKLLQLGSSMPTASTKRKVRLSEEQPDKEAFLEPSHRQAPGATPSSGASSVAAPVATSKPANARPANSKRISVASQQSSCAIM